MDSKQLKVSKVLTNTNDDIKPTTGSQQAKQVFYILSFKEFLSDLLMEEQEQM